MSVEFREVGRVTVIEPTHAMYEGGECDQMEGVLLRLAERGARVVVDLSRVDRISARCMGILASAQQVAGRNGGRIALCGTTRLQRWLLRKMGLAEALTVHDSLASAMGALGLHTRSLA